MFKSTHNKGFGMSFQNGMTISVQYGYGNYCDNYKNEEAGYDKTGIIESSDAEIAIWDKEGTWFNFGHDTVKGNCSVDEVAQWIYLVKSAIHLDHLKYMAIDWGIVKKVEE